MEALRNQKGRAVILCHQIADPDCICSALALKEGLSQINPELEVEVSTAESFSSASRRILQRFNQSATVNPSLEDALLIILDTSSLDLLSPLDADIRRRRDMGRGRGGVVVIDHHVPNQLMSYADDGIIDPEATSTSEIVYGLLCEMGARVEGSIPKYLLAGILSDTRCLRFASPKAVKIACQLMDKEGVDYDEAVALVLDSEDLGERQARLKAAQRMVIHRVGKYIILTSEVSSFAASSANALVALGADCAFVGSSDKEEVRISARSSKEFMESTGIHLGRDVMARIGDFMNGSGGGLRGAAGARGAKVDLSDALGECVSIVKELLKNEGK
jgi:nanoRNase/pAp phosphatase (c-di-AMP/oligoRNAs hydrolase)